MMENLEDNDTELPPPIEDITTIPEEASEELREEEEAAAMEAALRTPEGPIINTEAEKPVQSPSPQLSALVPQEWVHRNPAERTRRCSVPSSLYRGNSIWSRGFYF